MQCRTRIAMRLTLVVLACATVPRGACADIIGFGNFAGFTVNQSDAGSAPTVSPGSIRLTSLSSQQGRSIFFNTPQSVSAFSASFTYRAANAGDASVSQGAVFVLQNDSLGANEIGSVGTGGGLAYQGIGNSAAVSVGLSALSVSTSGYFTGGVLGGGASSISPVNLFTGNPIRVTVDYDGSILQTSFLDTVTLQTFNASYLANLPAIVGVGAVIALRAKKPRQLSRN